MTYKKKFIYFDVFYVYEHCILISRLFFQGINSLINELKSESCQFELINAKECVAAILEATLNVKILTMVPLQDSIKKFNFRMYTFSFAIYFSPMCLYLIKIYTFVIIEFLNLVKLKKKIDQVQ